MSPNAWPNWCNTVRRYSSSDVDGNSQPKFIVTAAFAVHEPSFDHDLPVSRNDIRMSAFGDDTKINVIPICGSHSRAAATTLACTVGSPSTNVTARLVRSRHLQSNRPAALVVKPWARTGSCAEHILQSGSVPSSVTTAERSSSM